MTSRICFLWQFATIVLLVKFVVGSFPENSHAISVSSVHDVPGSFFTGGYDTNEQLKYIQELKMVKIAGTDYFAITGRENLFLIAPEEFSPFETKKIPHAKVYTWKTDTKAKDLCVLKGQSNENCENYIRVVEQMDEYGNKLLICGTNSYQPKCRYLSASMDMETLVLNASDDLSSGTDKCPFGPDQTGASLYTGNSLYSATASDFNGRSYTITRSLGSNKPLRTPKFDAKFLNEPHFVKMVDDGKRVLVFMNEMVKTANGDVSMVSYVAQVCKNDVGGQHVLVRQWTKFEKTRLNCSQNGFYFDQLQDVSDPVDVKLSAYSNKVTKTIYATFTTPDHSVPGSAVCAFTLDAIHDALLGKFREERNPGKPSNPPSGPMHPGNCPNQKYTNSQLLFLKSHPLLEDQAKGNLLSTYVGERWSAVAVDTMAGPDKNWTVYFVGTKRGQVLRYLSPTGGLKNSVLLRRQDVFDSSRCQNATDEMDKTVKQIVVDPERDQMLVSFKYCVISLPLRACSLHRCEKSCLESADPYCGWNGTKCVDYITKSANVKQSVFSKALKPKINVDDFCVMENVNTNGGNIPVKVPNTPTTKKGGVDGNYNGNDEEDNYVNGSFAVEDEDEDTDGVPPSGSPLIKSGSLSWIIVGPMIAAAALLFFFVGFCTSKLCCGGRGKGDDIEKQQDSIELSKASLANNKDSLCKKIIASISPKRKRKGSMKPASLTHSRSSIAEGQQEPLPLLSKQHSKLDEYMKHQYQTKDGQYVNIASVPQLDEKRGKSRLNSASTVSQVTVADSVASYSSKRRGSAQPTSSLTSMGNRARPNNYSTAPRIRHPSGNRASDPPDYTNAPTLRADKPTGRMTSRHSTPVPVTGYPSTPTSILSFNFQYEQVVESTEQVLDGVKEVIEQQQRRSAEMETLLEESPDDARLRHESSDSGKGSSPRNSVQTEEQDKVSTLSRNRPDNLHMGPVPQRSRKRLNSEPTSPTVSQAPLLPASIHNPVGRSTSMRSQYAMSVPNYPSRKRSESFSSQHSQQMAPMVNGTPMKMQQMTKNGFIPQAHPNMYSTLPLKPPMVTVNNGKPHPDQYHRQMSYDTYSPSRYPAYIDQRDHPAMNMPDRYSSLPSRSQAKRSNKKPFAPQQYGQMSQVQMRRSSATPMAPSYLKQMSTPANFDQHSRSVRGKYVAPPSVPVIPSPLPEQNAV